jgi:hypothetical protein
MKKTCTFLAILLFSIMLFSTANATGLLTEDFNYTAGTNLTDNGWTANSGTGNMTIATSGLTYTGLQGSGIGLSTNIGGAPTLDAYKTFTGVSSGTI